MINALAISQKPFAFSVDDGCLENTPDTAEFSREFQLHQHLYDPEHDYPGLGKWVSPTLVTRGLLYSAAPKALMAEMSNTDGGREEQLFNG